MEELYNNLYGNNFTIISNEFLEKYLSDTKPEYIKVFLFYLWKGVKENYTIEDASEELDLDENVIEMALKYWIKKKLIKKESLIRSAKNKNEKVDNFSNSKNEKNELTNNNKRNYEAVEEGLLFAAEKLLGQTVSERQQELIEKCYNEYGFEEALIHYLLEYCSSKSQTTVRYLKTVATSWYEQKIKTVDAAKKFTESFENAGKLKNKKKISNKIIDRNEYNKMFIDSVLKK